VSARNVADYAVNAHRSGGLDNDDPAEDEVPELERAPQVRGFGRTQFACSNTVRRCMFSLFFLLHCFLTKRKLIEAIAEKFFVVESPGEQEK
jgi:hypothetical protein